MLKVVRIEVADPVAVAHAEARRVTGSRQSTGKGLFSCCYTGNSIAAKVSNDAGADGYMAWIMGAAPLMGTNPHVPMVRTAIIYHDGGDTEAALYIMELLQASTRWDMPDPGNAEDQDGDMFSEELSRWVRGVEDAPTPALREVVNLINSYRDDYGIDIHGGNVMRRASDGTWVVTDPLSYNFRR